ncbi:MAG: hypothetical protein AAGE98_19140, partial [Actinomycetota bacterium]
PAVVGMSATVAQLLLGAISRSAVGVSLADDCLYFAMANGRDQVVVGPIAVAATPTADLEIAP